MVISNGGIPCIEDAVTATADAVNRVALADCIARYEAAMSTLPLPTVDEKTLSEHDKHCREEVTEIFHKQIMLIDGNKQIAEQLSVGLRSDYFYQIP